MLAQLFRALARISLGLALVVVLFTASAAPSNAQPAEPNQITTVLLVRHADAEDGLLTEDGELRAEQLVQVLEKANVKAIFVTNRERSLQTAQPLIEKFQPQLKATTYKYQGKRKKI